MVERKVTMQKAYDAVEPVFKGKFTQDIEYARPGCIVRCISSTYVQRVAALDLVPASSLQRHRSKSAPGNSRDFDTVGCEEHSTNGEHCENVRTGYDYTVYR